MTEPGVIPASARQVDLASRQSIVLNSEQKQLLTMSVAPSGSDKAKYQAIAREKAVKHGLPVDGFLALVTQESRWNPRAQSDPGAKGLTQIMPLTWGDHGVGDIWDPTDNLEAGAKYLAWCRKWLSNNGVPSDWEHTLAAYNWGIGRVQKLHKAKGGAWMDHLNDETSEYVAKLAPIFNMAKVS